MSFSKLAGQRRSVRGFKSQPVPDEAIIAMLHAAAESPSGGNCQPWHIYVVKDNAVIKQIHEKAYHAEWFLSAPVVFVVCVDAERSGSKYGDRGRELYCIQDTGAAIQSMLLSAKDEGLDTCWCGSFDETVLSDILNTPSNLRPVALIPTGYGNNNNPKPKRRPMEEMVTFIGKGEVPDEAFADKGIHFEHVDMGGAVFNDINLRGTAFNNINMHGAAFTDINMTETSFGGLCLNNSKFGCVDMQNAEFENPNLNGSTFKNCGLSELTITDCNLKDTEISDSDITGLKINGVEIEKLLNQ